MFNAYYLYKLVRRLVFDRKNWEFSSKEYCPSCGNTTAILHSPVIKSQLYESIKHWELSENYKSALLERENYLCNYCVSNFRQRALANSVIKLLNLYDSACFVDRFKDGKFVVYETAAYDVFRMSALKNRRNYVISEYFDGVPFGQFKNGIRNENLEGLTFDDASFDIVMTSDVLEHVSDLSKSLKEISRVLKPGGYHVFTVPVDYKLGATVERARLVDGKIEHLQPPHIHGDSVRANGILAFRDFGQDVQTYFAQYGTKCEKFDFHRNGRLIMAVYYTQKQWG